jgi:hypothetical protein
VIANGNLAEVIGAVGYPSSMEPIPVELQIAGGYRKEGSATIQMSAAWIPIVPVNTSVEW